MDDIEEVVNLDLDNLVIDLSKAKLNNIDDYTKEILKLRKKHKVNPSKIQIRKAYNKLLASNKITYNIFLDNLKKNLLGLALELL